MLSPWLPFTTSLDKNALQLFCFPYGGGNSAFYQRWQNQLLSAVQICPVQLPGRGIRYLEPSYTKFELLIKDLVLGLQPFLQPPFAFFGHSMGALVCYEIARMLTAKKNPQPVHLFASAYHAPHLPDPSPKLHELPDDQFIDELIQMNGLPTELITNRKYLEVFLPALQADFTMCETYEHHKSETLTCPITVLGGSNDPETTDTKLEVWQELTTGPFALHLLEGDHFFIHSKTTKILEIIKDKVLLLKK